MHTSEPGGSREGDATPPKTFIGAIDEARYADKYMTGFMTSLPTRIGPSNVARAFALRLLRRGGKS